MLANKQTLKIWVFPNFSKKILKIFQSFAELNTYKRWCSNKYLCNWRKKCKQKIISFLKLQCSNIEKANIIFSQFFSGLFQSLKFRNYYLYKKSSRPKIASRSTNQHYIKGQLYYAVIGWKRSKFWKATFWIGMYLLFKFFIQLKFICFTQLAPVTQIF